MLSAGTFHRMAQARGVDVRAPSNCLLDHPRISNRNGSLPGPVEACGILGLLLFGAVCRMARSRQVDGGYWNLHAKVVARRGMVWNHAILSRLVGSGNLESGRLGGGQLADGRRIQSLFGKSSWMVLTGALGVGNLLRAIHVVWAGAAGRICLSVAMLE